MIDHRRALTLAATAIDFQLDARDRDALDEHVRDCPDCRREVGGFRRDAARLAALPPIAPPAWVRDTIGRPRRANPLMLLAAAAILLMAAAVAVAVGGGILRDRTAIVVPTAQPTGTQVTAPTEVPSTVAPSVLPASILSGTLLVRRTDPAQTEPVPVTFGLIDLAGGRYRSLGVAVDAALSADGSRVHLVQEDATCTPTLVTVDLQGVELERIATSFAPGDGSFEWSPDDRQVIFSRYVKGQPKGMCGSQGGEYEAAALLSEGILIDAASSWQVGEPLVAASARGQYSWSPDGSSILIEDPSPRLWVVDPTSADKVDLTPQLTAIGSVDLYAPRWAPDGRSIAFVYSAPTGNMVGMVVLAGPSSRTIGPYGDAGAVPVWSPDGRSIAVVRGLNGGTLTLLDPDGARPEVALDQQAIDEFAPFGWSADGSWLAATAMDGKVVMVSANGLEVTPVFVPPAGTSVQFVGWAPG